MRTFYILRDLRHVGCRADAILLGLFGRLFSVDVDKWVLCYDSIRIGVCLRRSITLQVIVLGVMKLLRGRLRLLQESKDTTLKQFLRVLAGWVTGESITRSSCSGFMSR